ncbi:MAG: sigma-70 family RNA polymerase sigma factor [Acidobacteriia bacterium]|nr:sigma-70 family RNA polymerase sigma factor [Terriglobia bacterium]
MEFANGELVAQARSGNADAFRVLVDRHSRGLFRVAFRMTGNEPDAEDVVQESFLRAYRQLGKFDQRASFGTWLYRITVNCALDLVRSRKRRGEPWAADPGAEDPMQTAASGDPTPERLAFSGEVRERVADALNELSAAERAAFVLRHYEGLPIEDVSRVLGCNPGAAKHSVFRAVQKLRRALEPLVSAAK